MTGAIDAAFERARGAAELLLGAATHIAPGWLVAGLALHLVAQAVRIRGWWSILRASYPTCRSLRHRDVTAAYFAGAGLNGLLPARAGDLVKLAFLRRRIPESRYATLAASSVPETTFEVVCGAALVVWMLVRGFVGAPRSRRAAVARRLVVHDPSRDGVAGHSRRPLHRGPRLPVGAPALREHHRPAPPGPRDLLVAA